MRDKEKRKKYNREWMRKYRLKQYSLRKPKNGKCPVCGIILNEENEYYHTTCPYYIRIHKKLDNTKE